nr:hypothetical protein [Hyphomonas sp. Mor2]
MKHVPHSALGIVSLVLAACGHITPQSHQPNEAICPTDRWQKAWEVQADFQSPESAAIATDSGTIFVSNVNGYSRNGKGFISQLSLTGDVLDLRWMEGLNAPTGLRVEGETLWVVDYDRIVKISIRNRAIDQVYAAPDEDPLLNDLYIADDGTVFVTGSASKTVYELLDEELIAWRRHSELLRDANGITADSDHVYVAGYALVAIDRTDLSIEPIEVPKDLFDLEGVLFDGRGGWFVSRIGNHPLVALENSGRATPLFSGERYVADFDAEEDFVVATISADKVAGFSKSRCSSEPMIDSN